MRVDQVNGLRRQREAVEHRHQPFVAELVTHHVGQRNRNAVSHLGGLNGGHSIVDFEPRIEVHAARFLLVHKAPFSVRHEACEGNYGMELQIRR